MNMCKTTYSSVGQNRRIPDHANIYACTLSNGSEGLWEGIATKKSTRVHLKMLQNPRSKLAGWSKYGDNSIKSAPKWDWFGSISVSKPVNISWSLCRFVQEPYSKWIELSKNGWVHIEDMRNNRSMGEVCRKCPKKTTLALRG